MNLNKVGEPIFSSDDLIKEIYKGHLDRINFAKIHYANDLDYLSYVEFVQDNNLENWPIPEPYFGEIRTKDEFDSYMQLNWYMPEDYKKFDIESYLLSLCTNSEETSRVKTELSLYNKHNMIVLLRFLKFLVDSMRNNNILWGVGRGSSVASYCLFLLGVHKVNSIKYELDINEFLK